MLMGECTCPEARRIQSPVPMVVHDTTRRKHNGLALGKSKASLVVIMEMDGMLKSSTAGSVNTSREHGRFSPSQRDCSNMPESGQSIFAPRKCARIIWCIKTVFSA